MKIRLTLHMSIALLKFRMGNAHDDKNSPSRWSSSNVGRSLAVQGSVVEYTDDVDFASGTSVNLNHDDVHGQLQLDSTPKAFNFIWVACSGRGTIVKVDTLTGTVLGEYRSHPSNRGGGNPSRTTVDKDGSVWLSNRNNIGPNGRGTIVHIGLNENNQCEDRNGDSVIQTSTGLGVIEPWADESGTRSVATADDECIVHYTEVNSRGTRHVSIDKDNNVWVSGWSLRAFDKVKGGKWDTPGSGEIMLSYPSVNYGGYGGLMDKNGFIWSAGPLLRWDTSKPLTGGNGDPSGNSIGPLASDKSWAGQGSPCSYGLCIDSQGNVWNTDTCTGTIVKYAPDGTYLGAFAHAIPNSYAQGCVVDQNDHVWTANGGENTVGHLDNDGNLLGVVNVGSGPTGVAVDRVGKVWSTNQSSSTLSRIDPLLNGGVGEVDLTVNLGAGCSPYNYGDMTGSTNIDPPNTGSWTVTYDHGSDFAPWGSIDWDADTPGDSSLKVEVKKEVGDSWVEVENHQELSVLNLSGTGQYLILRVSFVRASPGAGRALSTGDSPVLRDISFGKTASPTNTPTTANPTATPTTASPTSLPTSAPSFRVNFLPTTAKPQQGKSRKPSRQPTRKPSRKPNTAKPQQEGKARKPSRQPSRQSTTPKPQQEGKARKASRQPTTAKTHQGFFG